MNDWKYIVDLMGKLESKSPKSASSWMNSPFLYIRLLAIRQKGKEGEKIVKNIMQDKGCKVSPPGTTEFDLLIDGRRAEVKMASVSNGVMLFNALALDKCDDFYLLGLEPSRIRLWRIEEHVAEDLWKPQGKLKDCFTIAVDIRGGFVHDTLREYKIFDASA